MGTWARVKLTEQGDVLESRWIKTRFQHESCNKKANRAL